MKTLSVTALFLVGLLSGAARSAAQTPPAASQPPAHAAGHVSWTALPIGSWNPKLGTAFGGEVLHLHSFDSSPVSLFGAGFQFTSESTGIAHVYARTSLKGDKHRLTFIGAFGHVGNDYDNYLDQGAPLQTDAGAFAIAARYLHRSIWNSYVGFTINVRNYQLFEETALDDLELDVLGVTEYKASGLGIVLMHDTRDNEDMPGKGWYAQAKVDLYRLYGQDYDEWWFDVRSFWTQPGGHVFGVRGYTRVTAGASAKAESSIILRGYKIGQFIARHMVAAEAEERLRLHPRWGATAFAGVAYVFGNGENGSPSDTKYPSFGGGLHYILKADERMLVNLEYAHGNKDNQTIMLRLGYAW